MAVNDKVGFVGQRDLPSVTPTNVLKEAHALHLQKNENLHPGACDEPDFFLILGPSPGEWGLLGWALPGPLPWGS